MTSPGTSVASGPARGPDGKSRREPTRVGVVSGAGLSAWAPASVWTGDAFHRRLFELCVDMARPYAADVVDGTPRDSTQERTLNLLARIESTQPGAGAGALHAMSVPVPNEAHLLAALHLARGGLHVTVNFDDGVERAYALLSGSAGLAPDVPQVFHAALPAWRDLWPPSAGPLHCVSRPGEIRSSLGRRPLLVKLHGSLGDHPDGVVLPMGPMTDEPDIGDLGNERRQALATLATEDLVVVTGFSATDLASRSAVLEHLQRGRFLWMSAEIDPEVALLVSAIDPDQPSVGEPVDALRSVLPVATPPWPRTADGGQGFEERLDAWAAGLPPKVAAEALAWTLTDSGQPCTGEEILRRLQAEDPCTRTSVRRAEALIRRHRPGDALAARRLLLKALVDPNAGSRSRHARGYALGSLVEVEAMIASDRPPARWRRAGLVTAGLLGGRAIAAVTSRKGYPGSSARSATIAASAVLAHLEWDLPKLLEKDQRRRGALWVTTMATASARTVLDALADAPTGRRGAILERQTIELDAIEALLRGGPPAADALPRLTRLVAVLDRVLDSDGRTDAVGTMVLVHLAAGDPSAARRVLSELHEQDTSRGAPRLARRLVELDLVDGTVRPRPPPPIWHGGR